MITIQFISMDLDLKLKEVISLLDLIKVISWGAIPLLLSITVPILYITISKLLPTETVEATTDNSPKRSFFERVKALITLPNVNKLVVYSSLILFIGGVITIKIDQTRKDRIRNIGLRMKEYFLVKNVYQVNRYSLTDGDSHLVGVNNEDIQDVLDQYPNEFIEMDNNRTIVICDSVYYKKIMANSVMLLDNFMSTYKVRKINELINYNNSFTIDVANKLIIDSTYKYKLQYWVDSLGNRALVISCQ